MKKLFALLMTLVLVFSVSEVALADQAKLTVSGTESEITAERGEKVELTVALQNVANADTLGIEIKYDADALTKVNNESDWLKTGALQDFDPVKNQGVWAANSAQNLNGDIFKLVFTVNGDAPIEDTKVDVTLIVKNGSNPVDTYTASATVEVVCEHVYGDWTKKDDTNHVHVCENCQGEELEAHRWDAGVVTQEPTETVDGKKVYTCSACNATKEEPISATGSGDQGGSGSGNQGGSGQGGSGQGGSGQGGTTKPENNKPDNSGQGGQTTPDTEVVTPDDTQEPDVDNTEDVEIPDDETDTQKPGDDEVPTGSDGGNAGTIILVIAVIAAIGGAAFFFLKKK